MKKRTDLRALAVGAKVLTYLIPTSTLVSISKDVDFSMRRCISNIAGPENPYIIGEKQTKRMHFRVHVLGHLTSFNFFSHNGIFRVSLFTS